jgi:hypothetical protein
MSVMSYKEYLTNLLSINYHYNLPHLALLAPNDNRVFHVNLESREINSPDFLSVEFDHSSETVYFLVDRYYDFMDLSQTACVIQYVNAKGEGRMYTVPFYDVETYHDEDKMLVPWCIEGEATKAAGEVSYSIRFFKVDETGKYVTFNLNTLTARSKVLYGLNVMDFHPVNLTETTYESDKYYLKEGTTYYKSTGEFLPNMTYYEPTVDYLYPASDLQAIQNRLAEIEREFAVYWYDVSEL